MTGWPERLRACARRLHRRLRAVVRLGDLRAIETSTERYVRFRDALQVMAEELGEDCSLEEALAALDDEQAGLSPEERAAERHLRAEARAERAREFEWQFRQWARETDAAESEAAQAARTAEAIRQGAVLPHHAFNAHRPAPRPLNEVRGVYLNHPRPQQGDSHDGDRHDGE